MNKSKRSIFNSMSAAMLNLMNGFLGFFVTYFVIKNFGSDFNGVTATANQIVTILLLLEGGFTLATNVALLKPYQDNDIKKFNSIISATKNRFKKIGVLFLFLGIVVSVIYSSFVVSGIDRITIFMIILMAILPSAFSLYYATKYRILIQAEQKEFVISLTSMCSVTIGYVLNIFAINLGCEMLTVRFITMCCAFTQSYMLGRYCKKHFKNVCFDETPDYSLIKGTKDVMVQKLTSALYKTLPVITISMLSNAGTVVVSVYSLYNSIYQLIKAMLQALMDGPRLSLGQLISEKDSEYVYKRFIIYELVTIITSCVFIGTTFIMAIPFIVWYSKSFVDTEYVNYTFAVCLALVSFIEILHIPSGNYINMSGNFKKARNIQIYSVILLVVCALLGVNFFGFYGVIYAVLLTAFYLAVREIYYVHVIVFQKMKEFINLLLINGTTVVGYCILWTKVIPDQMSFLSLILFAVFVLVGLSIVMFVINWIFNKKYLIEVLQLIRSVLKRG